MKFEKYSNGESLQSTDERVIISTEIDYPNNLIVNAGSSPYVPEDGYLTDEDTKVLIKHLTAWLETGSLEIKEQK